MAEEAFCRRIDGRIVEGPIDHPRDPADRDFLALAAAAAEEIDWSANPWATLTAALKERSGRSGKALFLPLRRALTGRGSEPEMAVLLPLIGRQQSVARLKVAS